MTGREVRQLCVVLDQVWGGVDEGRAEGYRFVLADLDASDVSSAVREMMLEDRAWLPKAPEIAARALHVQRERLTRERIPRRLAQLTAVESHPALPERATP